MSKFKQVRKIGPTRRSISGFFSFRGEESIPYESSLERDFIMLKAADPCVSRIVAQPVQIDFRHDNGRLYKYTPDFLVYYDNPNDILEWGAKNPQLVEVKPREELQKNFTKWKAKFKQAVRFSRDNGFTFHFADESRIRTQKLSNLQFLEQFKRFPYTRFESHELERLISRVELFGHVSVTDLIHSLYKARSAQGNALAQVWYLLAIGQLSCDFSRKLNQQSEIWVNYNAIPAI